MENKVDQTKPIIDCQSVSVRYDDGPYILKAVSWSITPGSFYFLTGPSGAGKSTLLKLFYMGIKPSSGVLKIFSKDAATIDKPHIAEIRQQMGIVFQDFNLLPHLTVLENVVLPLKVQGYPPETRKNQAIDLLSWVGLANFLDAYPHTLSGGQRQRVAIARAVITRPKLLLADEPTGNVDEKIALKLLYLFDELHKLGTAVVIATHQRDLAKVLGYPEMTLSHGKLIRV